MKYACENKHFGCASTEDGKCLANPDQNKKYAAYLRRMAREERILQNRCLPRLRAYSS